jgi:stage II sporulation protein P
VGKRTIFTVICLFLVIIIYKFSYLEKREDVPLSEVVFKQTVKEGIEIYSPVILFLKAQQGTVKDTDNKSVKETINENNVEIIAEPVENAAQEGVKENLDNEDIYEKVMEENRSMEDNHSMESNNSYEKASFIPVQTPTAVYLREQLKDPMFLKQTFYTEDSTTYISEEQLDYEILAGYDAVIKQGSDQPQILIYHTHSQEDYADSTSGDTFDTIVGVGERLASILREDYGFNVIHHLGQYDIDGRDYAYSKAMEGISTVLENNPSIEVMIDLHRDETNADTRLVTTIQGKEMARFMFFNGLCYTRELGELENLSNPYIQENLAFAFQMQLFADEYYPGLTRRIYLKGYRYNMHFRPKSLLIELGSQTNTVEEAMNSCYPIAHIISSVLNGDNK